MEAGSRPGRGVYAAVDVHYLSSGGARAAAVLAADTSFVEVMAEHTVVVPGVLPYQPGEFFLRELPPLRAVLHGVRGLSLLVIDGYADLDPAGKPGLGAHAEFGIPVIGVAKSAFRTATHALPGPAGNFRAPVVRHRCRDAPHRRGGPGPAHGWPVPATRRAPPRRYARPHRRAVRTESRQRPG